MERIPGDIKLNALPGPTRGKYPAHFFRDEIVWSPAKNHFALAYTIIEAGMGNDVGSVLWASFDAKVSTVLGNPKNVAACCWYSPWCTWIDDETFAFKAQHYDGEELHTPLVVIHVTQGFAVLSGSNNADSRPNTIREFEGPFQRIIGGKLLRAIDKCK